MANVVREMKRIPDDVVEYSVFPVVPSDTKENELFDFLQRLADLVLAHFSDKLVNYIWQHEPFHLRPVLPTNDSTPPHLHGSTRFGDNIDDEWFIVSLLYEISREFSGCVIRVNDNDEEFLLIEAADALPKWLNPETAENRVFVYNGDLHVIPIPESPEEYAKFPMFTPSLGEAVACVRDCTSLTRCSQAIQNHLMKRLSRFPQKYEECIHHVNCFLPTPLAVLLDSYPSLVSAGVRTFYYRDPLELRACRPMKRFKPDDLVRTRVKMTRCLYAQLVQQQFSPDRRSGWTIVAPSNSDFLEHDIGVKLAHGFEILCSKCKEEDISTRSENLDSSNLRWQQFKQSLARKGYFRGEIEGSKLYTKLLNEAKQFYLAQVSTSDDDFNDGGQLILHRLKTLESKFQEFRTSTRNLPPSDDDSWINVTPEQVDEMMKSAGGFATGHQAQPFDLSKISKSMSHFVEHESGIDGAEFPRETVENGDADGQVVGSGMIEAMQKLFDFPDEQDSTGSDMSEYDWSDGSDSELGSPPKTNIRTKKSSLRKPSKGDNSTSRQGAQTKSKSVRFSGSDVSTPDPKLPEKTEPTVNCVPAEVKAPQRETPPNPPTVPPRPSKLVSPPTPAPRPTKPPPPRPSNNPPPVPARPSSNSRPVRSAPLSKPGGVVKPTAPPPPPPPNHGSGGGSGGKRDKKLEALMDAMDRELAATDVGKSFEREPKRTKPKRPGKPPPSPGNKAAPGPRARAARDIDDEDDDFRPVNIDLTVVKNTLESYKAQQGLPGPASNILAGFGLKLPDDDTNTKA